MYYDLPTTVKISNQEFEIRCNGDYRMVLDCFGALNDSELSSSERVMSALLIFYNALNSIEDLSNLPNQQEAVEEMFKFFNCGQESVGQQTNHKLVDWEQDAPLIFSAINGVANKEVRSEQYIHWWTFMGYYMDIGECTLSNIVSIRGKIARGEKLEKYENKFKRENPQYFTLDYRTTTQNDNDKLARELWNSGKDSTDGC